MPSFKFKNGKFVPRTEEEERRLAEYFASKPASSSRKVGPFIQITLQQLDKLRPSLSPEAVVFFSLCYESYRHRGAAFILPSDKLAELGGFKLRTQQRIVMRLEKAGLISVRRRHRQPPIVQVLSVTT